MYGFGISISDIILKFCFLLCCRNIFTSVNFHEYRDGSGLHFEKQWCEKAKENTAVISVSLGRRRKFCVDFREDLCIEDCLS
jgi:hypothetical protein